MSLSQSSINKSKVDQLSLKDSTNPTLGSDLVGYITSDEGAVGQSVKDKLDQNINVYDFGFSPQNTASQNQVAFHSAIAYANGRKVVIECDEDYQIFQASIPSSTDYDVDLEFRGSGKVLRLTGGFLNIAGSFFGTQSVISMESTDRTVNGSYCHVIKINMTDTSEYRVGDMVRIVSDDLDPSARTGYTARRGEVSVVSDIDPDGTAIYIPASLEDQSYYITNVRIARYSRRRIKIRGLKIQSSINNSNQLLGISNLYKPDIEATIYDHGNTGVNSVACVNGRFKVSGNGFGGTISGSERLGYMFKDANGTSNTLYDSVGTGWRHMVTTEFSSIAENSSISRYGAPRDLLVTDCVSIGSQGVPFDEHEGARRTVFNQCRALCELEGATANTAFQFRGIDGQVINAFVDNSFDFGINVHNRASGIIRILGGDYRCVTQLFQSPSLESGLSMPDTIVDGVRYTVPYGMLADGFLAFYNGKCTISNSVFESYNSSNTTVRCLSASTNSTLILNNVEIYLNVPSTATQNDILYCTSNSQIIGDVRVNILGDGSVRQLLTISADSKSDVEFSVFSGSYNTPVTSSRPNSKWKVNDYRVTPAITTSSVDTLLTSSLDPVNNGELSFTLLSNTQLRVNVKGSDGVIRTSTLTLE